MLALFNSASDGGNELFVINRLFDKIEGAVPHGLHRHRNIGVAGYHDHREASGGLRKHALQAQSIHVRHAHVQHNAIRSRFLYPFHRFTRVAA